MYAVASLYSFEAIIYCMVAVHVFGGVCLLYLAGRAFALRFPGESLFHKDSAMC